MYDDHYGLTGRPFQLTPDPAFWFDTLAHRKAMAYLGYGLSQGEGFIVITGEPGAGKTTLLGHLMGTLDRERMHVIKIVTTQVAADDLLQLVAGGLGIDTTGLAKAQVLGGIERGLHGAARAGKRVLLIVDEAQALSIESLEELRMLSNFQAGGYPLLQIFLLGQPEFRERLGDERMEQLRQRVIAMHRLDPMDADELEPYLIHRLSVVGWRGKPRFTNDAVAAIYRWSGGVPRKVNQLASRVLLFGAIEQIDSFSGADVDAVIADLDHDTDLAARPAVAAAASPPAPIHAVPDAAPQPQAQSQSQTQSPASASPLSSGDLAARIARLEARLEEQDAALRRVLTLMVDFIETEDGKGQRRGAA